MKDQPELTPYQKSVLTEKPQSWKHRAIVWIVTAFVGLMAYGFYCEYQGTLPNGVKGWLMFSAVALVCYNWLGVFFISLTSLFFSMCGFVLNKCSEEPWTDDNKKTIYKTRTVISAVCKTPLARGGYRWNFHTYVDLLADWSLFAMMVTAEHPLLAFLHASSLVLQYLLGRGIKNKLTRIVAEHFDDPLESEGEVDMDALINKLCDPESKNDQDT